MTLAKNLGQQDKVDKVDFLLHWTASSLVVWLFVGITSSFTLAVLYILAFVLYQQGIQLREVEDFLLIFMLGVSSGFTISVLQRWLIKYYLHIIIPKWVLYSTIGGGISGLLLYIVFALALHVSDAPLLEPLFWLFSMPLYVLPLSIMQSRALTTVTDRAWEWILGNLLAGFAYTALLMISPASAFVPSPLIQGFVTGLTFLRLKSKTDISQAQLSVTLF